MQVQANVGGSSFNEVTFYAKVARRRLDAHRHRRHPARTGSSTTSAVIRDGDPVAYRAVVRDNAGHTRVSERERTRVPKPTLTWKAPADNANVFGELTVEVMPDPEKADQRVVFERRIGNGAWQVVRTDSSSPAYVYYEDLSKIAIGTSLRYRATLTEPDGTSVRSSVRTVTRVAPQPLPGVTSVTVAGSIQSELGCPADWDPTCATTHLAFEPAEPNGVWRKTFTPAGGIPAGNYAFKIALNDSWNTSYGVNGGGVDVPITVPAGATSITFSWDQGTKAPSVSVN